MAGGLGDPAIRGIAIGPESLVPYLWLTQKQIVSRYDCLSEDALIAAEDFGQLRLKFTDPIQDNYEIIRPIVLFDETVSERSRQTGIERSRVNDKARRFVQKGMLGLVDQRTEKSGGQVHQYPEAVATYILYLKQMPPGFLLGYFTFPRLISV